MNESECRVEGCEAHARVRGMCLKHYHRVRRHGTPNDPEPARRLGPCSIEGCDKTERSRGWCGMHLQRWYRTGTTDESPRSVTRYCRMCGERFPRIEFPNSVAACATCYPKYRQERESARLLTRGEIRTSSAVLREEQNGLCAICSTPENATPKGTLHLDHDHKTGFTRGLLCSNCNMGIGQFKDDPTLLLKAIRYLRKHGR